MRRGSTRYSRTGDGEDNALPILSDLSFSYMRACIIDPDGKVVHMTRQHLRGLVIDC